jgi:hypothetical protein
VDSVTTVVSEMILVLWKIEIRKSSSSSIAEWKTYDRLGVTVVRKNAEQFSVTVATNEEPFLVQSIARRQLSALHVALPKM